METTPQEQNDHSNEKIEGRMTTEEVETSLAEIAQIAASLHITQEELDSFEKLNNPKRSDKMLSNYELLSREDRFSINRIVEDLEAEVGNPNID